MAAQIELTAQEVQERQDELLVLEETLADRLKQQRVAREFGDLSENTEYEVATKEVKQLQKRKEELLEQLDNYVLVEPNDWPQFTIGCIVGITLLDNQSNEPVAEERLLRIASEGNSVQKNTLGINSPLGKAILNGTDGIYTVQTVNGGVKYYVRKETSKTI